MRPDFELFEVDTKRGFLPPEDPLVQLPSAYEAWEELAHNLPEYLEKQTFRAAVDQLLLIEKPLFQNKAERERAMLLLSFFAHAYIHCPPQEIKVLPAAISIPWVAVAEQLGRLPILSHASAVLNNWRRLDQDKPIQPDNLTTLLQFNKGRDEAWFYLVTVNIEQIGARAIPMLINCRQHTSQGEYELAIALLKEVQEILQDMTQALREMYLHCDPTIFYNQIRPWLASFEQVHYEGTDAALRSYHGGSAAQSSLLQFFDAIFGMQYDERTQAYLLEMRKHMPRQHAKFLQLVESGTSLRDWSKKHKGLQQAYSDTVQPLIEFRNEHLKIVGLYIMKPAAAIQATAKGTGGTNPLHFLKAIRNRNKEL